MQKLERLTLEWNTEKRTLQVSVLQVLLYVIVCKCPSYNCYTIYYMQVIIPSSREDSSVDFVSWVILVPDNTLDVIGVSDQE